MKAIRNTIIVKIQDDKPYVDCLEIEGAKLFVDGDSRLEHYAKSVGEVISSGIEGVKDGDIVGLGYQSFSNYEFVGNDRVFLNVTKDLDGSIYYVVEKENVLCVFKDKKPIAFGEFVFLKSIEHKSEGDIKTFGVDTRLELNREKGVGLFVSGDLEGVKEGDKVLFKEEYRSEYFFFDYKEVYIVIEKQIFYGYEK